jgi:hypothetical protein
MASPSNSAAVLKAFSSTGLCQDCHAKARRRIIDPVKSLPDDLDGPGNVWTGGSPGRRWHKTIATSCQSGTA